jgi:exodeoxyribonuclease VII small subunit
LDWESRRCGSPPRAILGPQGTASGGRCGIELFSGAFLISSDKKSAASDVTTLSFEAALRELEAIVGRLEQGDVDLEDSITLYERGQALKAHCDSKLKSAEGRLEKIVLSGSGAPTATVPMEA